MVSDETGRIEGEFILFVLLYHAHAAVLVYHVYLANKNFRNYALIHTSRGLENY